MSRLHTALERSNAPLLEVDPKTSDTDATTAASPPADAADAKQPSERPGDRGAGGGVVTESGAIALPPLLIDSSPGFRREIGLLHRSLTMLAERELKSVLICGAENGAGTSTIALNVAAYASEETTGKALLIEANFERPYIHRWTNGARAGFSDLLEDQGSLEQYIIAASTAGLQVMSAGRLSAASNNLILESRVRYLLTELHKTYPLVVFDGAPVNRSLGTLELAKAVDGVILVVRPNTLTSDVIQARTALANVGANTLGFAFNDF